MTVGIEALNVYCGVAAIPVASLIAGRGLDLDRMPNLAMTTKSVALPVEDPVTHAVNAARPLLAAASAAERDAIELLVTATESGLDYSKSVASYVHDLLGLNRRCRILEVKQACYASTGALQLAAGYIASGVSPGAKALVVGTDVSLVDWRAEYTEPTMGTGAAAILVGDRPRVLALDVGACGPYGYETLDSARPTPTFDVADSDRSLFAYLDCLRGSFAHYADRVEGADFMSTFDQLAMHTPFVGLVRAAHRTMVRESTPEASAESIETDFRQRVAPSLVYPASVGNLCSGSVYLALASLVDNGPVAAGARVGMYSYGSGCAAEFFSGVVDETSRRTLAGMRIGERLGERVELSYEEYAELLEESRDVLTPVRDRVLDVERHRPLLNRARASDGLCVCTAVENYHRRYVFVDAGLPQPHALGP